MCRSVVRALSCIASDKFISDTCIGTYRCLCFFKEIVRDDSICQHKCNGNQNRSYKVNIDYNIYVKYVPFVNYDNNYAKNNMNV